MSRLVTPPMSAIQPDKELIEKQPSPNLREQAEMFEKPADMEDPEDLDFLLDD